MGRFLLFLAFILAFLVTLIINIPARLVLERINPAAQGLYYERVAGTIWSGRMTGSVVAGQPLGTISFTARPSALLQASLSYDITLLGPTGAASGTLLARPDRSLELSIPSARINVHELRRLQPRLREVPSEVSLENLSLALQPDGYCRRGRGLIRTDTLQAVGERLAWQGPEMAGQLNCTGGEIIIALDAQGGEDAISARIAFDAPKGLFEVEARVQSRAERILQAVQQFGFQAEGDVYVYRYGNRPQGRAVVPTAEAGGE
jgi:hypothetical protein